MMKIKTLVIMLIISILNVCNGYALDHEEVWEMVQKTMSDKPFKAVMDIEKISLDKTLKVSMEIIHSGRLFHRMEYIEPASQKGKVLIHARKKLWLYLPKLGRSMQITRSQAITNGGLGFDDLSLIARLSTFDPVRVARLPEMTYRLELVSKMKNAFLDRAVLIIDPDSFMPIQQMYYTKNGVQARIVTILSVKETDAGKKPETIRIENLITHETTIISLKNFQSLTKVDPKWFKPI